MIENGYLIQDAFFQSKECDYLVSEMKSYVNKKFDSVTVLNQADLIVPEINDFLNCEKLINLVEHHMNNKVILASSEFYVHSLQRRPYYDSLQISSEPKNKVLSVWIALDDVTPVNGPMYYYPKSHVRNYVSLKERVDNAKYTVINTSAFFDSIYDEDLRDFNFNKNIRKIFLPKKGDLMLMHGNLIHGESDIYNFSKTRPSLIGYFLIKNEKNYFYSDYPVTKIAKTFEQPRQGLLPKILLTDYTDIQNQEITPERAITTTNAIQNLFMFLKDNQFQIDLNSIGEKIISYECKIKQSNLVNSYGYGKGSTQVQSMASAMFESFEHLIGKGFFVNEETTLYISVKEAFQNWVCFPEKILEKSKNNEEPLLWDIFNGFNIKENLIVPSIILDTPGGNRSQIGNFPFGELDGAYSNSGTASGSTYEEAILHSLNELIERDAHSLLLLKTFCRNKPCNLKIIDKVTLPEKLGSLLLECEVEVGSSFTLINMTTDFNLPAIACFAHSVEGTMRPLLGFGCSPSADYAIERAILETVQTWHSYLRDKESFLVKWNSIDKNAEIFPRIKYASQENYQAIIDKGFYEIINYSTLSKLSEIHFSINGSNLNISFVLDKIVGIFSNMAMHIYVKKLFSDKKTGITCVRSIVRELEIFNLVTVGLITAPGNRGIKALQD